MKAIALEELSDEDWKTQHTRKYSNILIFKQSIDIKQARYMMKCLSSYLPDYNAFSYDKSDKH